MGRYVNPPLFCPEDDRPAGGVTSARPAGRTVGPLVREPAPSYRSKHPDPRVPVADLEDEDDFDDADDVLPDEVDGQAPPADGKGLVEPYGVQAIDESAVALPGDVPPHTERPRQAQPDAPAVRLSSATKAMRVSLIAQMRVQGMRRRDIHSYVNAHLLELWGNPSERTIDRMVHAADVKIKKLADVDIVREKGKAVGRFEYLFRKALANNQIGTALRIQVRINKLHGLDAALKVKHANDPDNPMPVPTQSQFIVVVQEVKED